MYHAVDLPENKIMELNKAGLTIWSWRVRVFFEQREPLTFEPEPDAHNVDSTISTAFQLYSNTYDHRHQTTRDPVRSPLDKLATAELVLRSVTTGESSVLYVYFFSVQNLQKKWNMTGVFADQTIIHST